MSSIYSYANLLEGRFATRQARVHVCDTCHVFLRLKCTKEWRIVESSIQDYSLVKRIGMSRAIPFILYHGLRRHLQIPATRVEYEIIRLKARGFRIFEYPFPSNLFRDRRVPCNDLMRFFPAMTLLFDWYCVGDDRVGLNYNRLFQDRRKYLHWNVDSDWMNKERSEKKNVMMEIWRQVRRRRMNNSA